MTLGRIQQAAANRFEPLQFVDFIMDCLESSALTELSHTQRYQVKHFQHFSVTLNIINPDHSVLICIS